MKHWLCRTLQDITGEKSDLAEEGRQVYNIRFSILEELLCMQRAVAWVCHVLLLECMPEIMTPAQKTR
jgi:hypothetical protein